jgi:hypothetical protein
MHKQSGQGCCAKQEFHVHVHVHVHIAQCENGTVKQLIRDFIM